jgi:hypothetical protein
MRGIWLASAAMLCAVNTSASAEVARNSSTAAPADYEAAPVPIAEQFEAASPAVVSQATKVNDGTDPTQLTTQAEVTFEHLGLRNGFSSQTLTLGLTIPLGESKRTSIKFKAPFVAVDVLGDDSMGLGDVSVKVTRVLEVTRKYGIVLGGEVAFDTADRWELGSGKTVFKGSSSTPNSSKVAIYSRLRLSIMSASRDRMRAPMLACRRSISITSPALKIRRCS